MRYINQLLSLTLTLTLTSKMLPLRAFEHFHYVV